MKAQHISVIFVVDDEPVISKTVALILQQHGYASRFFTDPLEALAHIKTHPPDLLISDVVMPHLSGVELAMQVKASHPGCKILLFSGQALLIDALKTAREQGHNFRMVAKPIHPTELLEEIRRMD